MNSLKRNLFTLTISTLLAAKALAFDLANYTPNSVLSSGKWVKVSVAESGMHLITNQQLQQWGFSDASKVRIHGYGGAMISDALTLANYVDDLPMVQSVQTSRGLVFYAVGPVQQNLSDAGVFSHDVNPYSSLGYYFITESTDADAPTLESADSNYPAGVTYTNEANVMLIHEQETTSPGKTGRLMVGEDFNYTRTRTFNFDLPDRTENSYVTMTCNFLSLSVTNKASLSFAANGAQLPSSTSDNISVTTGGSSYYGQLSKTQKSFSMSGEKLALQITYSCTGTVSRAALDYLEIVYQRTLRASSSTPLDFFTSSAGVKVDGASGYHVWDVTNPQQVYSLTAATDGTWCNKFTGVRHYAVWADAATLPSPVRVGVVSNQDIHGMAATTLPDMIIITPTAFKSAADELATIHAENADDPLNVLVLQQDQVLQEFGSGAFDPGALRRCLKMFYDYGAAAGHPLRYALMMGRGTCDNRALTTVGKSMGNPMPLWVSSESLADNTSYSTDDYFGLLSDGDGQRAAVEKLDIAVGRIPCFTLSEANIAVEKIRTYIHSMPLSDWRTRIVALADDENEGVHMEQTEAMFAQLESTASGMRFVPKKVYCDAYTQAQSTYPEAREAIFNAIEEGTAMFCFIGHGSPNTLGSKTIITVSDFRTRFYLRKIPFLYAATCNFLKWDDENSSSAELLMFMSDGGIIGGIAALRPVFITNNGKLTESFGKSMAELDEDNLIPRIGNIYINAKNRLDNDSNKLRYVLMGDPALRLCSPSASVVLEQVNDDKLDEVGTTTVMAHQTLNLVGTVRNPDGTVMDDFNGQVSATLFDADYSTTSHGYGEGIEYTFEQRGDMLFTACAMAENGHFNIKVTMPMEIADNYRPTTLSLYAYEKNGSTVREAMGVSRSIYAYGYDTSAADDDQAPVIHTLVFNTSDFQSGDDVNPSPLLIATVSDDTGINLSSAGVGKRFTLIVDDVETYPDVAQNFTPDAVPIAGAMSGTVNYQLSNLAAGNHTLRMRVWDISGNYSERSVDFNVVEDLAPEVYKVYADANPASTSTNFYVTHNRPEAQLTVKITVYNLLGTPIWTSTTTSRSDMETSSPVKWNLTDMAGRRVQRGIYLYRAEISTDGETFSTGSQKIAVTAGN